MTLLFLRLSSSRDTAASSTHRVLADLALAAHADTEIDFAFLPPLRDSRVLGTFTGREWSSFDLILVTNSCVQEAINLPWLLYANGVSPWAPDRPESFPPVLLGGSNALASQCLVRADGTAVPDAMFFGEAEDVLPVFLRRWREASGSKRERLARAAHALDGFWVTGTVPATPIRQAVARGKPPLASPQPLLDNDSAGTARLSVGAGCAAFCSFCFEGYERKPYRSWPLADVLAQARSLKAACGARAIELDAFNLNTYAELGPLVERCARLFHTVSFKSQRADGIAACPGIVDLERAAGKGSYTLGIEGISARMRAFLCKSLADEAITAAIQALLQRGAREIKLFYILTAHETPADLAAFGDFCSRLSGWIQTPPACTRVVLSFGRLVRMPNTPLARDRLFLNEADWRFCVDGVAAVCRRTQLESRFAFAWPDYLATQLLAACTHDHADRVVRLACDGLTHHGPWRDSEAHRLADALALPAPHAPVPSVPSARCFPFIQRAVSDVFLESRWDAARRFLDAGYCLGAACSACGACADASERQSILSHSRTLTISPALIAAVAGIEADKRRLAPFYRRACLPADFAGRSPGWVSARLLQILLTRHPDLIDSLLAVDEAVFSIGDAADERGIPCGETLVRFRAWEAASVIAALAQETTLFPPAPVPPAFTPGRFVRATWQIASSAPPRDTAQTASEWLHALRLPHSLQRDGDVWRATLATAAVKKKWVFALTVTAGTPSGTGCPARPVAQMDDGAGSAPACGSTLTITFSPQAPLRTLLARLPPASGHPQAICLEVGV
ncbi:MAG: hypothetical protein WCG22_05925 [Lentisphaerota bacterium]